MFKNTISLTSVLIKSLYDINSNSQKKHNKKNSFLFFILFIVLFWICFVPISFTGFYVGRGLYDLDVTISKSLWNIILSLGTIIITVFSVFSVISVFFFSTDNEILLPLPLKSWEILLARFFTALFMVYLTELLFIVPISLGIGIGLHFNVLNFLNILLILMLLPIIPIVIIGIIFVILSSVINFAKFRNIYNYVIILFALSIGVLSSLASSNDIDIETSEGLQVLIEMIVNKGDSVIHFFPILKLAVNSLTNNHILIQIISIILFIAINLIAIVIFCGLFEKRYYSSLKNSDSIFNKSKKLSNIKDDNVIKKESFIKSYIQVEWKTVARSPVLFCNTFLMALLWPIIIIILLVISFIEGSGEIGDFIVLIQQLDFSFDNSLVVLICLGVIIFLMIMNVSSVTSISRMGKDASFVKYIPLSSSIIVHIKIFWGVVLSMGILVVLSIISLIFGLLHWYDLIAILVLVFSVILLLNYIGVFIDLKKPYLNWDNEVAAVKK